MNRPATALVTAVLLVVASVAVPATAMAQSTETATETPTETPDADESDEAETNDSADANASAGELLQGAIGVQEAEIEGEIRSRSFGIRVAQAASDEAKADVVATELEDTEQRLDELEERKQRLEERRDAGNISRGTYRAEMAKLAAETETVQSLANDSATVAEGLPEDVRERKGINATAIRTLSERADELSGPEVSRIARSIAGPSAGTELDETPDRRGAVGNETRTGTERPVNGTETDGDNRTNRTATDGDGDADRTTTDGTENDTQTATPTDSPDGTETETTSETPDDADSDARSAE